MTTARTQSSLTFADAQREMRVAYFAGASGMLVSALVWSTAAIVAARSAPERAIWVLFVGGMLIHPLATVLNRLLGRPARHARDNPLGGLALATTIGMILALPLAYAASRLDVAWFFPAMLFVIGGRYLAFATIFGLRIYWVCGAVLAAAGYLLARAHAAPALGALAGAAIEAAFAAAIFVAARREAAAA